MRPTAVALPLTLFAVVATLAVGCSAPQPTRRSPESGTTPSGSPADAGPTPVSALATGYIGGRVDVCTGVNAAAPRSVTVVARRGGTVVASEPVMAGDGARDTFRFAVPVGDYAVRASNWAHIVRTVTVRAGLTANADFPNVCD